MQMMDVHVCSFRFFLVATPFLLGPHFFAFCWNSGLCVCTLHSFCSSVVPLMYFVFDLGDAEITCSISSNCLYSFWNESAELFFFCFEKKISLLDLADFDRSLQVSDT